MECPVEKKKEYYRGLLKDCVKAGIMGKIVDRYYVVYKAVKSTEKAKLLTKTIFQLTEVGHETVGVTADREGMPQFFID